MAPEMARRFLWAAVAAMSMCGTAAWAGPPFLTDDPEPVDLHHAEINLALQATKSAVGRSGTLAADINWGCAAEVQCHVAVPGAFSDSAGGGMRVGSGDLEFGVKYRFLNLQDAGVMAAVYPTAIVPTGDASRGLGNGRAQLLLPLWVQKAAGKWKWDAGAAYLLNRAPEARSNWYVGLLGQRSFGDWSLGAELFHRSSPAVDVPATTGFNVGSVIKIGADSNLLVSIGRAIEGVAANRRSLYLAYQIEL